MSTPSLPRAASATGTLEPTNDVLVFEDVAIAFEDKVVLDGISFRLPRGETKAIFGVAGSGKSTLLKLALGLLKPDSGHIYTLGEDVTQMPEEQLFDLRRKVGIVVLSNSTDFTDDMAQQILNYPQSAPVEMQVGGPPNIH